MNAPATIAETSAQLPVEQRAALALAAAPHETQLIELAQSAAGIVAITNADGYQECHARRVALKRARVAIASTGKAARDDATAFAKAVIAEEKRLIAIIEPEETRLQALQDAHDAAIAAAKQARETAEREHRAAIQARIDWIRERPVDAIGKPSAELRATIDTVNGLPITPELYGERTDEATNVRADVRAKLVAMLAGVVAIEQEAETLRLAREQFEREKRERDERIALEDAARASAKAAEDAARAAEQAQREQEAAAARAEQQRRDDEAAAARQRERATLEARADPWATLATIEQQAMAAINGKIHVNNALSDVVRLVNEVRAARAALNKVTP